MFSEGKININSMKAPETTEQSRLKRIENTIAWMTVSMNLNYHGTENMQSWRQAYYICSKMEGKKMHEIFDWIIDTDWINVGSSFTHWLPEWCYYRLLDIT